METTTNSFIDKAINGLRKAAIELEEFQLQLALGKAEAADKFEDAKKKFNEIIHNAKEKLNEGKVKATDLKRKFEGLQIQLALGKAETKDAFNEQKKKIIKAIQEIEHTLKATEMGSEFYLKLNSEVEKFKIKMQILHLRFELGKLNVKDEFEERKADFAKNVDKIKLRFAEKESAIEKNWDHFNDEISEAYTHLKKAFIF